MTSVEGRAHERDALLVLRDALDIEPHARAAYVAIRCAGDARLHARVLALLAASVDADAPVATPHEAETAVDPLLGSMLGPFRVVERIGRGGMGVVYRGERKDAHVTQTVALKLIRRGFDFDDVEARFLRERRILAALDHPNLAHFIDGGIGAGGRPWFALEFVRGEAITQWCDSHRVGLRERVGVFLDVCAAVQYAHVQLVVHRDLKPANILVDADGHVKLLDFGIAKLLDDDGEARATTIGFRHALTPEYAAPEQFGHGHIGVATDVYSLGVILYELLAGTLPHAVDRSSLLGDGRAMHEAARLPLTQALTRGDDASVADRLRARSGSARTLRRQLRGDLARIVEKALDHEPAHRYATVQALSDDLLRWLQGLPLHIAGNRLGYRLAKFARRHRIAIGTAFGGLLALAALAGYHFATLSAQLERTRSERNRAEASLDFLQKLLASPNPQFGAGATVTLGDFLQDSAKVVAADTALDATTRLDLELTLAGSLKGVDRYDEALALARKVADQPASVAQDWPRRVEASALAGEILVLKGEYEAALRQLDAAATLADANHVNDPMTMAGLFAQQSIANNHLARWDESTRLIDRALAIAEPVKDQHPERYATWLGFASIPRAYPRTDLPGAEALARRALAFLDAHGLAASGQYAVTQGDLAQILMYQGRFEQAEPLLRDVIDRMVARYGENNRETSFKLNDIALLYYRWNRLGAAREWQDRATRSMRAALGESHPFVAQTLSHSADIAFHAGDLALAVADSRTAAAMAGEQDRKDLAERAMVFGLLADCQDDGTRRVAVDDLRRRVSDLGDAFTTRAFRLRAVTATCLLLDGHVDEARAVVDAFATRLDAEPNAARNDFQRPLIARIRAHGKPPP